MGKCEELFKASVDNIGFTLCKDLYKARTLLKPLKVVVLLKAQWTESGGLNEQFVKGLPFKTVGAFELS